MRWRPFRVHQWREAYEPCVAIHFGFAGPILADSTSVFNFSIAYHPCSTEIWSRDSEVRKFPPVERPVIETRHNALAEAVARPKPRRRATNAFHFDTAQACLPSSGRCPEIWNATYQDPGISSPLFEVDS
jgi:hypothetical protein